MEDFGGTGSSTDSDPLRFDFVQDAGSTSKDKTLYSGVGEGPFAKKCVIASAIDQRWEVADYSLARLGFICRAAGSIPAPTKLHSESDDLISQDIFMRVAIPLFLLAFIIIAEIIVTKNKFIQ